MKHISLRCVALGLACAAPALAQVGIDPAHKHAWAENIGWSNWRDAGGGALGVQISDTFLSGRIWHENVGWITLGDGTPTNGVSYANLNGLDCGVNRNAGNGALTGFAWAENTGWINFSGGAMAALPNPARYDGAARRFRGYAWCENTGWLNLDDAARFVGAACPADFNGDGQADFFDYLDFVQVFANEDAAADFNGDGQVDFFDYLDFVAALNAGC